MDPSRFIGRAPQQVERFVASVVEPDPPAGTPAILGQASELRV